MTQNIERYCIISEELVQASLLDSNKSSISPYRFSCDYKLIDSNIEVFCKKDDLGECLIFTDIERENSSRNSVFSA